MVKVIRDFWIIVKNGIVVFDHKYDQVVDVDLFGAFMSALNTYAEEIAEGGIKSFDIPPNTFTLIKEENFLFVATSSKKVKKKIVAEELKRIVEKFFNRYPKNFLKSWEYGDVKIFSEFETEIVDSFEEIG